MQNLKVPGVVERYPDSLKGENNWKWRYLAILTISCVELKVPVLVEMAKREAISEMYKGQHVA